MDFVERLASFGIKIFLFLAAMATLLLTIAGVGTLVTYGYEIKLFCETVAFGVAFLITTTLLFK